MAQDSSPSTPSGPDQSPSSANDQSPNSPVERATAAFGATHGHPPTLVARAPGRVNLIGEHTDYNDGFVLPMALPFATVIAAEANSSQTVELTSAGYGTISFQAGEVDHDLPTWARYIAGVGFILADEGYEVSGWRGAIDTDIPTGASLSSSAALEIAALLTFTGLAGRALDLTEAARMGQRVENEVLGLQTGIMDQFISANASEGHASLIDCRSLTFETAPVPATVVVFDTMSRRELVDSEYDLRRASCERAAAAIGVPALRDATIEQLDAVADKTDRLRAEHVIHENGRTLAAVAAMRNDDPTTVGRLMNESHASLRDLYEVSGPELDTAVEIAQGIDGCYGARMTGGGFAGCCVALVKESAVKPFLDLATQRFASDTDTTPRLWPCRPSAGAAILSG